MDALQAQQEHAEMMTAAEAQNQAFAELRKHQIDQVQSEQQRKAKERRDNGGSGGGKRCEESERAYAAPSEQTPSPAAFEPRRRGSACACPSIHGLRGF